MIREWKLNLDNDQCTLLVFLNLKIIFKTVNRTILFKKKFKYGISGVELIFKLFVKQISNYFYNSLPIQIKKCCLVQGGVARSEE